MHSINVFKLYEKANSNKNILVNNNKRPMSIAEETILECIIALGLEYEYEIDANYDSVYKMLFAKNLDFDYLDDYRKELTEGKTKESQIALKCETILKNLNSSEYNKIIPFIKNFEVLRERKSDSNLDCNKRIGRKESVLEHIYGSCVIIHAIENEYKYCVDFEKTIKMLLLHETDKIVIGDITNWNISKEEKKRLSNNAVHLVLKNNLLRELVNEFNQSSTLPSEYASLADKLESDLQLKMNEMNNNTKNNLFDIQYENNKYSYNKIPCMRRILERAKEN